MPSTYSPNLGIEKPATGEQSGSWGGTVNTNYDMFDQAIVGQDSLTLTSGNITSGGAYSLVITDGAVSEGRNLYINVTDGGDITGDGYVELASPDAEKVCYIKNTLSASRSLIVFQGSYAGGRSFTIPNGNTALLKFDGGGAGSAKVRNVLENPLFEGTTTATQGTMADESSDTTCFPLFATAATGDLPFNTNSGLTYNASTGELSSTSFTTGDINASNFIPDNAGDGVDFSINTESTATGVTMTTEKLSWFEEGTWTPVLYDNGLAVENQTYITQNGFYQRIGRVVKIWGRLAMSDLGTLGTGEKARIGQLPFVSDNSASTPEGTVSFGDANNLSITAGQVVTGNIPANVSHIDLELWDDVGGVTFMTISEVSDDGVLGFSGSYITA